ncbi:MAG: hypothetical protein J5528_02905 [Firmicutes bacterium]|nr:hypothetical protein [Bacillota bacterium]
MREKKTKAGQFIIELQEWRSIMALIACCITLACTSVCVIWAVVRHMEGGEGPMHAFRYFTTLSNSLTFFAAGFIFPYAINGIRMKRLIYPRWLSLVHYSGTVCTTLTFVFAMVFILPYNKEMALGGSNFFLHLICPIAVLISFMMVESSYEYRKKDTLICLIPLMMYSILYTTKVVVIGEVNGGWPDMYMLNTFLPFYLSFPAVWLLALAISFGINRFSSFLFKKRQNDMLFSLNRYIDPVELKLEVYELGRLYGTCDDENDLSIPYDLLKQLAGHYTEGTTLDELFRMYTAGLLAGVNEKEKEAE